MKNHFHSFEILLILLYKALLEFYYMPHYFSAYGYMVFYSNANYVFSLEKFAISVFAVLALLIFTFKTHSTENETFSFLIRIILLIAIIPAISTYAFLSNVKDYYIVFPLAFYVILLTLLKRESSKVKAKRKLIELPRILNIDIILLFVCGLIAVVIWAIMGMPLVTSFDDALEQRLALRAEAMPRIMGYIHAFLGGVVFPYLFANFLEKKKVILAILSLCFGYLAFSVNGMKTWIFLYALFFIVVVVKKLDKGKFQLRCILSELVCISIVVVSVVFIKYFNVSLFISQFGRMLIIPSTIGFKSINFFSEHELLYLRESIFRFFAQSPYTNGSDFFIFYGSNSTITSGRSNCGLWGDAFRNFGLIGVLIYPILYKKVFACVINNATRLNETMKSFILLLVFWNAINLSFFTWLLTGGVIVIIVLEKIESSNLMNQY